MTTPRVTVPVVSAAHRSEAEALAEVLRSRGRANSKHDISRAANLLDLLSAAPAPEGVAVEALREALIQADLKIRSLPGTDQSDVEFIREVLAALQAEQGAK